MAEIYDDSKFSNIEVATNLGLTLSGTAPRIKHTGTGTLAFSSAGPMTIETSDTATGITVGATTSVPVTIGSGGGTLTLGGSSATTTFSGNVTISGDLTVSGDTVSHDVVTIQTEDPIMRLNEGTTGTNTSDIGFVGDRGTDNNIGFVWDESNDQFACILMASDADLSSTTIDTITDYADLRVGGITIDDAATVGTTLGVTGNFSVNTSKFTVTASNGNTAVDGTLDVTGVTTLNNNVTLRTGDSITLTHTSDANGEDLTIAQAGAFNASLLLTSAGTGDDAIGITASAGGVDIDAAASFDVDISGGQVAVSSKDNVASAISLTANQGTTETIVVTNSQGTSVMTDGNSDAAIQLVSTAGGIGVRSTANLAGSIQIEADGGTDETIIIHSDQGTGATSINLVSDAGGITLNANGNTAVTNNLTVGGTSTFSDNVQLNDNDNLYIGTGQDLTIVHNATNTTITSATGDLTIDNTNVTGTTQIDLGTDTTATDFQVRNNSGTSLMTVNGIGATTFASNINDANMTVNYTGTFTGVGRGLYVTGDVTSASSTNCYALDVEPTGITTSGTTPLVCSLHVDEPAITVSSGTVTTACSLFIVGAPTEATSNYALYINTDTSYFGGNVDLADNASLRLGANQDFTAVHNGTNTVITSTTGNLTFDNTNTTGSTIMLLGTDTTATGFDVQNNSASSLFKVDGSGAVTFGTDGSATNTIFYSDVAGDNMTWDSTNAKLVITGTDGSNALEVPDGDVNITDDLTVGTNLTINGTSDLEGYAAIGNGSALSANVGLVIDYDTTYTGVGQQLLVKGTVTGAANTNAHGASITPESITVPVGTTSLVSSLHVKEPIITATGTVTNASTLYIEDAPTEGSNNYALWVDDGLSKFDGAVTMDGVLTCNNNLSLQDNDNLTIGAGNDLTIVHDTTNTVATSITGDLIVDNTNVTGSSIMRLGTDTTATDFQVQNNSESALFTVNGNGAVVNNGATGTPAGSGFDAVSPTIYVSNINGELVTTILIDIGAGSIVSSGVANDIIGEDDEANAYITQITTAVNGVIYKGEMVCVEVPTTGDPDLDLNASTSGIEAEDADVTGVAGYHQLINGGTWTLGAVQTMTIPAGGIQNDYLYLSHGGTTNGTYDAGKLMIKLYGVTF